MRYGASGMQGWRKRMEDSHISDLEIGNSKEGHVFGVFDGHGGNIIMLKLKVRKLHSSSEHILLRN